MVQEKRTGGTPPGQSGSTGILTAWRRHTLLNWRGSRILKHLYGKFGRFGVRVYHVDHGQVLTELPCVNVCSTIFNVCHVRRSETISFTIFLPQLILLLSLMSVFFFLFPAIDMVLYDVLLHERTEALLLSGMFSAINLLALKTRSYQNQSRSGWNLKTFSWRLPSTPYGGQCFRKGWGWFIVWRTARPPSP